MVLNEVRRSHHRLLRQLSGLDQKIVVVLRLGGLAATGLAAFFVLSVSEGRPLRDDLPALAFVTMGAGSLVLAFLALLLGNGSLARSTNIQLGIGTLVGADAAPRVAVETGVIQRYRQMLRRNFETYETSHRLLSWGTSLLVCAVLLMAGGIYLWS